MADAKNNVAILSEAAPSGAVGNDVVSIAYYDHATAGNLLGGGTVSNNPSPLVLGEKYELAIGALVLRQPVAVGTEITQVATAVTAGSGVRNVTVDSASNISNGQDIAIAGRVYRVSTQSGTTLTLSSDIVIDIAVDDSVRHPLETEEAAKRKLEGLISGGIWIEYYNTDQWTDIQPTAANKVAFATRTAVTESQFTIS